jgi:hypothetical protein
LQSKQAIPQIFISHRYSLIERQAQLQNPSSSARRLQSSAAQPTNGLVRRGCSTLADVPMTKASGLHAGEAHVGQSQANLPTRKPEAPCS